MNIHANLTMFGQELTELSLLQWSLFWLWTEYYRHIFWAPRNH